MAQPTAALVLYGGAYCSQAINLYHVWLYRTLEATVAQWHLYICSGRRRVLGFPLSVPRGHVTGEVAGYKKCFTFPLPERPAGQFLDLWSPFPEDPLGSLPWPGAEDSSAPRPAPVTPRTSPPLSGRLSLTRRRASEKEGAGRASGGGDLRASEAAS